MEPSATARCFLTRRARCAPYPRWETTVPPWRTSTCAARGATLDRASRWPRGGTRPRRSSPTSASTSGPWSQPGQPGRSISHHEAAETFRDPRLALRRAQGRCGERPGWDLLPDLDAYLRFDHLLPPENRDHGPRAWRRGTGLQLRPLRQPYRTRLRGGARIAGGRRGCDGFRLRLRDGGHPCRASCCGADGRGYCPCGRPALRLDRDAARPGLRG